MTKYLKSALVSDLLSDLAEVFSLCSDEIDYLRLADDRKSVEILLSIMLRDRAWKSRENHSLYEALSIAFCGEDTLKDEFSPEELEFLEDAYLRAIDEFDIPEDPDDIEV